MELNHQIRLCRPFPFRFGFRAISHNVGIVTTAKQALQKIRAAILLVRLHEIPPPKESMKSSRRTAACDGAYVTIHDLHPAMSNLARQSGTQAVIYDCWTEPLSSKSSNANLFQGFSTVKAHPALRAVPDERENQHVRRQTAPYRHAPGCR
jgi:hypothetical protein